MGEDMDIAAKLGGQMQQNKVNKKWQEIKKMVLQGQWTQESLTLSTLLLHTFFWTDLHTTAAAIQTKQVFSKVSDLDFETIWSSNFFW